MKNMDRNLRLLSTLTLLIAVLGCIPSATVTVRKLTGISLDGNRVMIVGSAEEYYGSTLMTSTPFIQMCTFIEPETHQLDCVDINAGLVSIQDAPARTPAPPSGGGQWSDDDDGS